MIIPENKKKYLNSWIQNEFLPREKYEGINNFKTSQQIVSNIIGKLKLKYNDELVNYLRLRIHTTVLNPRSKYFMAGLLSYRRHKGNWGYGYPKNSTEFYLVVNQKKDIEDSKIKMQMIRLGKGADFLGIDFKGGFYLQDKSEKKIEVI